MIRFRYGIAFFLVSLIYLSLICIYLSLSNSKREIKVGRDEVRVKISLIEPEVHIEPKPIATPKPPPPVPLLKPKRERKKRAVHHRRKRRRVAPKKRVKVKRVIKRRVVHSTPAPKPKEVIEPYIYSEPKTIEPIVETIQPEEPQKVAKVSREDGDSTLNSVVIEQPVKRVVSEDRGLGRERAKFLRRVRGNIYANKRYPLKAKRRRIEGVVHLTFDIEADGSISNIRMLGDAPLILKRAVKRSLRGSFPIDIPDSIAGEFPMRDISINVDFKLR